MQVDFVDMQNMIWIILPLLVIQLVLLIIALRDWYNRREILGRNRNIWFVIILFFGMIGPIIYLLFNQILIKKESHGNESMDDWRV